MRTLGFTLALLCVSAGSVLGQVKNLEEAPDLWSKHFENGDATSLAGLYASTAVLDGGVGDRYEGRMAIEAAFRHSFGYTNSRTISIVDRRWREFGDMAIHHNTWVMVMVESGKATTLQGRSSVVFQKTEDGWWIVDDHATLTP